MGNELGTPNKNKVGMKTTALGSQMTFDRKLCIRLRNSALGLTAPTNPHLSRKVLSDSLQIANIDLFPDSEVIMDLYTMWDVRGDERVPLIPFFIGLCPLACQPTETFRAVLRFAISIANLRGRSDISSHTLYIVLKSMDLLSATTKVSKSRNHTHHNNLPFSSSKSGLNCTVSYIGDSFLRSATLRDIVEHAAKCAVDTTRHRSGSKERLCSKLVIEMVAKEPVIVNILAQRTARIHINTTSNPSRAVSFSERALFRAYDQERSPLSVVTHWTQDTSGNSLPTMDQPYDEQGQKSYSYDHQRPMTRTLQPLLL